MVGPLVLIMLAVPDSNVTVLEAPGCDDAEALALFRLSVVPDCNGVESVVPDCDSAEVLVLVGLSVVPDCDGVKTLTLTRFSEPSAVGTDSLLKASAASQYCGWCAESVGYFLRAAMTVRQFLVLKDCWVGVLVFLALQGVVCLETVSSPPAELVLDFLATPFLLLALGGFFFAPLLSPFFATFLVPLVSLASVSVPKVTVARLARELLRAGGSWEASSLSRPSV